MVPSCRNCCFVERKFWLVAVLNTPLLTNNSRQKPTDKLKKSYKTRNEAKYAEKFQTKKKRICCFLCIYESIGKIKSKTCWFTLRPGHFFPCWLLLYCMRISYPYIPRAIITKVSLRLADWRSRPKAFHATIATSKVKEQQKRAEQTAKNSIHFASTIYLWKVMQIMYFGVFFDWYDY